MFNENNYIEKMRKTIDVFTKELSSGHFNVSIGPKNDCLPPRFLRIGFNAFASGYLSEISGVLSFTQILPVFNL